MSRLVVACLRPVDPRPEVDPLTGVVTRDGHRARLSAADAAALELALRIAEAWDAPVLAVAAGPVVADRALREAVALGAAGLRVPWPPGAETTEDGLEDSTAYVHDLVADQRELARALAAAISSVGEPSVVLCGDRSTDRGTGALPAYLAHELGAAQALGLVAVRAEDEATLLAERRLDAGRRERLRVPCPAVCSVEGAGVRLRRSSLPAALAAATDPVTVGGEPRASGALAEIGPARPYRPRTRPVPPPASDDPRTRVLALTGVLTTSDPPVLVGPTDAASAADALLAFLARHGYLEAGADAVAGSA